MRCVILDDYQDVARELAPWDRLPVSIETLTARLPDEDAVVEALRGTEIVVAMRERTPFPASLLARLPDLRLLVSTGPRNASIDVRAARELGITVCGTASAGQPPAELTWALILGLTRSLVAESTALRSCGPWQSTLGVDLHGATLGVMGLGKIGSQVARVGLAFGMDVVAWSQNLTQERAEEVGVRRASSELDLVAAADVLTLHLVLSRRSRGIVGERELAAMKRTAFLVNTSRAGLVDTAALVAALTEGRIAGAGLDVFDTEPLPEDDVLRSLPNVLATPHLGYVTRDNYTRYYTEAVEDIEAFLAGTPVRELP